MNIGFVVHRFSLNEGTGGYVVRLVEALASAHEITVYAAEHATPVPDGVHAVHVPAVRRPASATILTFPTAFAAVRRPHDLVHAQGWVTGHADVVTAHIVLAAWRRAARAAGARPPPGERLFGGYMERREAALFRRARIVIAPSHRVADDIRTASSRQAGPVTVIPHGFPAIDGAQPDPMQSRHALGLPTQAFIGLFAGDARKGLAVAFAALARVPTARLAVASHSHPGPWLACATACGVADRVHWLGPQRTMAAAYAATDVLIHATPYDTFGLVVAEAMAAGRPAIVSRHAGIAELLDGSQGWIVGGDLAAETTVALAAASDATERGRRARAARATAGLRPWSHVVRETMSAYETL